MISIFKPTEKFLIFNISPGGGNSVFVGIDVDKRLHFDAKKSRIKLPKFLRKFPQSRTTNIINLHPSIGASRIVPFQFTRQSHDTPLDSVELENFLAQFAQKTFLEFRSNVAEELRIDELDTILIETRPFAYSADGSSIGSPLGHKSKNIHGFLELLFTVRSAFEAMQQVLYSGSPVFMTSSDKSELMSLRKLGARRQVFLECDEGERARLLGYDLGKKDGEMLFRKFIEWSPSNFFIRIEELWGVDRSVAMEIYSGYLKNNFSGRMKAQIEKIFKKEVTNLFSALKKSGARGEIHTKTSLPLPVSFPARQMGITLLEFPFDNLFSRLGFEFDKKLSAMAPNLAFERLAPLIECYYDKSDTDINHSLRRRIHWLIS